MSCDLLGTCYRSFLQRLYSSPLLNSSSSTATQQTQTHFGTCSVDEVAACHELSLERTRMQCQCPMCRVEIVSTAVSSDTLTHAALPFVCFIARCASLASWEVIRGLCVFRIIMPHIRSLLFKCGQTLDRRRHRSSRSRRAGTRSANPAWMTFTRGPQASTQ